jgi:LysM repeat protein
MYAGSKYAPTSNAGTAKARQRFTATATSSDDNNNYTPSALAPKFEAAGATLPPATDPRDRFRNTVASSLYDSDIFKPYVPDPTEEIESYLANTAVEDALKDALGIDDTARQMYQGIPTQEEPEPNIDMSVLQGALQPEPITVEELPDVITKAGDTLTAIAEANGVPVQDVIDANPQIKNPDMIRPGQKVKLSKRFDTKGETPVGITTAPEKGLIPALTSNVVFSDPEMSFIVALEQFRESPYELNSSRRLSPNTHKSGLTIANGFDVGQHNKATLEKMGLDDSTISKFSDWIGVNPDTIIDPDTNLPAANRVRGHQLMAEKFNEAKDAGTLPELSYKELEEVAKGSYDVLGTDVAKRAYGPGFDDLDDSVKAVLTQEAYVRGKVNSTSIDRARQGLGALDVLDAMPETGHLADRKRNAEQWLRSNTFSDDKQLSNQGIQMLTNLLIDDLGLQRDKIAVDSLIGRGTRAAVNEVLSAAGKTPPPATARGDARRKELMEELANERLLPSSN